MISDLDETIKQLLVKKGALDPAEVVISFDAPDREWSASISKPTINIYLYDIRENHQLRVTDWTVDKDPNGFASRRKNPSQFDLAYLITVWTNDITDEHRLLWQVLHTLSRYAVLPEELLPAQLAKRKQAIKTTTAQPDGLFKNPADFWGALDNQLKPSINYVVTLPLDLEITFTAPLVKTKVIKVKPPAADAEKLVQVAGTVRKAGRTPQGIPGAMVIAEEARMTASTDGQGRYSFPKLPEGEQTFQVVVAGKKLGQAKLSIPGASYDLEV